MRAPSPQTMQLYNVILLESEQSAVGIARNLFNLGVREAGQDYRNASKRLKILERAGLVRVVQRRNGVPIEMQPLQPRLQLSFRED
jgi:hypothetical protein